MCYPPTRAPHEDDDEDGLMGDNCTQILSRFEPYARLAWVVNCIMLLPARYTETKTPERWGAWRGWDGMGEEIRDVIGWRV